MKRLPFIYFLIAILFFSSKGFADERLFDRSAIGEVVALGGAVYGSIAECLANKTCNDPKGYFSNYKPANIIALHENFIRYSKSYPHNLIRSESDLTQLIERYLNSVYEFQRQYVQKLYLTEQGCSRGTGVRLVEAIINDSFERVWGKGGKYDFQGDSSIECGEAYKVVRDSLRLYMDQAVLFDQGRSHLQVATFFIALLIDHQL